MSVLSEIGDAAKAMRKAVEELAPQIAAVLRIASDAIRGVEVVSGQTAQVTALVQEQVGDLSGQAAATIAQANLLIEEARQLIGSREFSGAVVNEQSGVTYKWTLKVEGEKT